MVLLKHSAVLAILSFLLQRRNTLTSLTPTQPRGPPSGLAGLALSAKLLWSGHLGWVCLSTGTSYLLRQRGLESNRWHLCLTETQASALCQEGAGPRGVSKTCSHGICGFLCLKKRWDKLGNANTSEGADCYSDALVTGSKFAHFFSIICLDMKTVRKLQGASQRLLYFHPAPTPERVLGGLECLWDQKMRVKMSPAPI